jgi:HD-like signal output (HDOD) protein
VVDLQDVTDIIKGDVGLTVQLLRLAAREMAKSPGKLIGISELVVQVGVAKLFALATETKSLTGHLRVPAKLDVCERFWTHSRITALIAEELASQCSEVTGEQAYLAGLLCHIGNLPEILGWATAGLGPWHSRHIGYRMAKAWEFPCVLRDMIGGYGGVSRTRECRALVDIAEAADNWATRLEALATHDPMRTE